MKKKKNTDDGDAQLASLSRRLFEAILDDDRAKAKELLGRDPRLAPAAAATEARFVSGMTHWIYEKDTALHAAAAGYRVEIAKLLLAGGADPCAARNHRLGQPIHYAADGYYGSQSFDARRQVAMIRLLIEAGADIHARDKNGATPLHRAVRTRCAAAVSFLLEAGADPASRNKPGSTPFHLAVQNTGRGGSGSEAAKAAQRAIIEELLERGTSVTLEDANGKSVLDSAGSEAVRRMLEGGR